MTVEVEVAGGMGDKYLPLAIILIGGLLECVQ
jgi:hypothetical protein